MSNRNSSELEYYELMVSNAFPYIGEKIFTYLDFESLLNCTFVCQLWKEFVDGHENWWLKALQVKIAGVDSLWGLIWQIGGHSSRFVLICSF